MKSVTTSGNILGYDFDVCHKQPELPGSTIVLLHGAAFTKDTWRESGIFDRLCGSPDVSAVYAVNLPVSATYKELQHVLQAKQIVADALVTPSASGRTITSWIQQQPGDDNESSQLQHIVKGWIPVASYSVLTISPAEWKQIQGWRILAVHGTKDSRGRTVSETLQQHTHAQVVELTGGHPCYLDSPHDFVAHVLAFVRSGRS